MDCADLLATRRAAAASSRHDVIPLMNAHDHDGDDDASADGAAARNLFRTSSCSSSSDYQQQDDPDDLDDDVIALEREEEEEVTVMMGNIRLAQKTSGASIAERLWPAAEYLATFVLDFATDGGPLQEQADGAGDEASCATEKGSKGKGTVSLHSEVHAKPQGGTNACDDRRRSRRRRDEDAERGEALTALSVLLRSSNKGKATAGSVTPNLRIIELGAGVGLTSIKIATTLPCRAILTDLDEALPLLRRNVELNSSMFVLGTKAVQTRKLAWGTDDYVDVLDDVLHTSEEIKERSRPHREDSPGILILGSDCVYFDELHLPLERTLASILSSAPPGSVCLLAGMRRWKRDNAFYANLGRKSRTGTHELRCVCVQEDVSRGEEGKCDEGTRRRREIRRVFAVRWLPRRDRSK